ncbi:hypothetical protein OH773_19605 [Buttiauxella sp. WJP83]|uniref:hypothetical protein n=1 Tax=Buttiauxella sp. WJP83 TaxID=2986951 RepID=UPI0022DE0F2B|nr:hypothetical protein [Buttiauxella sp. WJP83]WBM70319.1 hypothetical protein OH773_19605 [Buttiauxella sp. WJP83]
MKNYYKWLESDGRDSIARGGDRSLIDAWESGSYDFEVQLSKNTQHIMLFTTDEAFAIANDLYNKGTTFAGNIRDTKNAAKNIFKLVSYQDAGKLVFRLKGLGVKAERYIYKGITYIKVTGYPSLRRILIGTRYKSNNLKILELGIGKAGINFGIMDGGRFCIYFSGGQRLLELILSSEHDVAAFIGNIDVDVAKVIVTIFVTKLAVAGVRWAVTAIAFSVTLPISLGMVLVVVLGVVVTTLLSRLDEHYHLSDKVIKSVREAMAEHQKMIEQNISHNHYGLSLSRGGGL